MMNDDKPGSKPDSGLLIQVQQKRKEQQRIARSSSMNTIILLPNMDSMPFTTVESINSPSFSRSSTSPVIDPFLKPQVTPYIHGVQSGSENEPLDTGTLRKLFRNWVDVLRWALIHGAVLPLQLLALPLMLLRTALWFPENIKNHFKRFGTGKGVFAGLWFTLLAIPTAFFASAVLFILYYKEINSIEDVITSLSKEDPTRLEFNLINSLFAVYGAAVALASFDVNLKFAKNQTLKAIDSWEKNRLWTVLTFIFPGVFAAIPLMATAYESLDKIPLIGIGLGLAFGTCNLIVYGISRGVRFYELVSDFFCTNNWKRKDAINRYTYLLGCLTDQDIIALSYAGTNNAKSDQNGILLFNASLLVFNRTVNEPAAFEQMLSELEETAVVASYKKYYLFNKVFYAILSFLIGVSVIAPFGHTAYKGINTLINTFEFKEAGYQLLVGSLFSVWTGIFYFATLWNSMLDTQRCNHVIRFQPGYEKLPFHEEIFNRFHMLKVISMASSATVLSMAWRTYYGLLSFPKEGATPCVAFATLGAFIVNYVSNLEETVRSNLEREYAVHTSQSASSGSNVVTNSAILSPGLSERLVNQYDDLNRVPKMLHRLFFTPGYGALPLPSRRVEAGAGVDDDYNNEDFPRENNRSSNDVELSSSRIPI